MSVEKNGYLLLIKLKKINISKKVIQSNEKKHNNKMINSAKNKIHSSRMF